MSNTLQVRKIVNVVANTSWCVMARDEVGCEVRKMLNVVADIGSGYLNSLPALELDI